MPRWSHFAFNQFAGRASLRRFAAESYADRWSFTERGFYAMSGSPVLVQVHRRGLSSCDRVTDVSPVDNGVLAQLSDGSWVHGRRVLFCSGTDGRCSCVASDFAAPAFSRPVAAPLAPEVPSVQPDGRAVVQLLVEHRKGTVRQFDRWSTFTVPSSSLDAWKASAQASGKRFRVVASGVAE